MSLRGQTPDRKVFRSDLQFAVSLACVSSIPPVGGRSFFRPRLGLGKGICCLVNIF